MKTLKDSLTKEERAAVAILLGFKGESDVGFLLTLDEIRAPVGAFTIGDAVILYCRHIINVSTREVKMPNQMQKHHATEVKIGGVIYIAQNAIAPDNCTGCAFRTRYDACFSAPYCSGRQRSDGRHVIFVRKNEGKKA